MRRKTLKLLTCASAVAIGSAIAANGAFAQTTVNVPVTLTSNSAITVANTADMDFGSWILIDGTSDSTLVLSPVTRVVTPTANGGATVVESVASASVGTVTISTPASAAVNHWYSNITDFPDAGLSLGTLTYSYNGAAAVAVPAATGTTITTTGSPTTDTLEYGGTVTLSATPANAAHTATVTISFEY